MALKLVLTETSVGVECEEAYAKIDQLTVDKTVTAAFVAIFANEAARRKGAQPVERRAHGLPTESLTGDILPAVYAALKAMPEYAGAEDC